MCILYIYNMFPCLYNPNVTTRLSTADVPASRKSPLSLVGWAYGTPPSPPPSHEWAGSRRSSVPSVETLECPARSPDSQSPSGSCALRGREDTSQDHSIWPCSRPCIRRSLGTPLTISRCFYYPFVRLWLLVLQVSEV